MFDFGLETPSRFVHGSASTVEGSTPGLNLSDWTTGLTPSLFKSSKAGSTTNEDENPFDSLFQPSKPSRPPSSLAHHQHSSSLSTSTTADPSRSPTKPDEPTGHGSALNKLGLFFPHQFGRKRALSSPALLTPNLGLSGFDFGEFPLTTAAAVAVAGEADEFKPAVASIQPSSLSISTVPEPKRIKSEASGSTDSSPAVFERPQSGASLSPDSSSVVTPPDLAVSMPAIAHALSASQTPKAADHSADLNASFDPSAMYDPGVSLQGGADGMSYEQFFIPGLDMDALAADPGLFSMPGFPAQAPLPPAGSAAYDRKPSLGGPSGSSPKTTGKKATGKGANKGGAGSKKKAAGASVRGSQAGDDLADALAGDGAEGSGSQLDPEEAEKRASHLERNRIAACKSRQKKKMKVSALETQAAEVSAQNAAIQQRALQLQQEVYHLRSLLDAHQGCGCEHVRGYLAREAAGGGIPTIHALAGRVLSLDYTNSPKLGSVGDVYASLGPAPPAARPVMPLNASTGPPVQLGAPIPLSRMRNSESHPSQAPTPTQQPAPLPMSQGPPLAHQFARQPIPVLAPHPGPTTAPAQGPAPAPGLGMLTRSRRTAGADEGGPGFEQAVLGRQASGQMQMQMQMPLLGARGSGAAQKPKLSRHWRSNSVPLAATPGWNGVGASHAAGSYFPQLV